ncbi:YCF48-related protein [Undibacterium sp. TS12]|uniref:WD40/YVTN/BNR-like repeat-containing protein n=1 Tax=Undibacterium sp. TS12 TaxID=2908202 RepID=UPI001F4CDF34|nr:YCF48-related protein [Undibacterium sp. TS12]MCH8619475.1 YCF48-related protein [Undibacterium sp. TS12]
MKTTTIWTATILASLLGLSACSTTPTSTTPRYQLSSDASWSKLNTVPYKGKQDDIFFVQPDLGWYVNGGGKIYKTTDGGSNWQEQLSKPGTFFRTVGFVDAQHGYAGNIGTDYYPGVTDTTPLYETFDGGANWQVAKGLEGISIKGLCAIDVLHDKSGGATSKTIIHAGGRVGGPAALLRSVDGGASWKNIDMTPYTGMILDVKFFDANTGFVFGASSNDTEKSHARIIMTKDGGQTWKTVYESIRPFEITWKASFPTRDTGYVTIQSYNPDPATSQRYVAKTEDGGQTWREVPMVNDLKVREFGIGFIDANTGWVGTVDGAYQTTDGGQNWKHIPMGRAVNKIRLLPTEKGFVGYAIGVDVFKLTQENARLQ